MSRKEQSLEDCLIDLMRTTINTLQVRIKAGEASPQDVKNAIQLLKDNGITCDVRRPDNPLQGLLDDLPDLIGIQ